MSERISPNFLLSLLDRMQTTPVHEIMRDEERKRGFLPIVPGERSWLSADDWPDHVVVSTNGTVVRIVAIIALRPGQGSFRRLIASIQAAGLTPHVVAPSSEMQATMRRWGWAEHFEGMGFDREEFWTPPCSS